MTNFCGSCGHPLPDDVVLAALTPLQRSIFSAVKSSGRKGITGKQLIEVVYANDVSGTPNSPNIVSVVVRHINIRIEKFDLFITGRRGPGGYYTLEKYPTNSFKNKYIQTVEAKNV